MRLALHLLHEPLQIIARAGDADYADRGTLPQISFFQLGNGNVEFCPQPVFQRAHHLALVFERVRRFKDDASEVRNGMECGIAISNYGDIKVGDVIEAFVTQSVAAEAIA